jgi:hypothetical protein
LVINKCDSIDMITTCAFQLCQTKSYKQSDLTRVEEANLLSPNHPLYRVPVVNHRVKSAPMWGYANDKKNE